MGGLRAVIPRPRLNTEHITFTVVAPLPGSGGSSPVEVTADQLVDIPLLYRIIGVSAILAKVQAGLERQRAVDPIYSSRSGPVSLRI